MNSIFSRAVSVVILAVSVTACDQSGKPQNENKLRWQKIIDTDPRDGAKDIQMLIGAVNRDSSQQSKVILVLSCMQDTTSAYVLWHQYLGVYDPEVTWRVGTGPSVAETWVLSTDSEATFAPEPIELIKQMMSNDLFLIKTTVFGSTPVTVEFNTAGLKTEVKELRETCAW